MKIQPIKFMANAFNMLGQKYKIDTTIKDASLKVVSDKNNIPDIKGMQDVIGKHLDVKG